MEENGGDDQLYIPQVTDNQKPKIGMKFSSLEEAYSFYNQYAREAGFSVRINNSKKNKMTNEVVWKKFVCFKEGHTDQMRWNKHAKGDQRIRERARGEVRTGCKSNISLVKEQTGSIWVVTNFIEDYNHPLSTPSKVHLLRSHRNISTTKKELIQQFSEANMSTCQPMQLLEIEYDGPERVGCTENDIENFEKELRDEQKDIDVETLIEFFASEKEKNSTFFFDYEMDSDNRFSKCFWADHVSRRAYSVFGDVVVFDTTYNTNKYGLIFALFVGVNHHHQTTVFGCGFLSDEKTESFVWLFKKFIEALPKGPPNMIITDHDPAMTKVIAQVFPQTVHRYYLWHILNKFSDKLHPMTFQNYYQSMMNVIINSTTVDEFEKSWEEVIKCANLEKNDWLLLMYELRHKWVPVYFGHVFCAGMSSSQRFESSHSFFKRYVSNKNSLIDFITRFNRALRHQRHSELVADHIDMNEHPEIKTNWPMETQMVKLYTKKKWMEFQSEMSESHGYYVQQASIGVELMVYHVMNFQSCSSSKPRVLTHDKEKDYISCSCKKFEFEGIPCRHMLAYFRINQVFHLPDKYILKRWTRNAKAGAMYALWKQNFIDDPERFLTSRHSKLSYKVSVLIDDASLTDEGTNFLNEQFDCIYNKIQEMNISRTCGNGSQRKNSMDEAPNIIDPSSVRTKGCGKRLKSSKGKSISKSRLCRGCGHRGMSHDKRNCPILQQGSIINHHNSDGDTSKEDLASIAGSNNMCEDE
ncbi:protein FAR1-RELATED SEQUENCE 5-like [Zingiber officinale]|uniref:protein FAR1-RELATED SEQUENCE 5-like n=1 Tax=Zingiber officinale TaxID=94328 RepID=UPI001C4AFF4A|nr:protein FAR1-RELATED SEQUENCE 5-like [Zingiber officinale]